MALRKLLAAHILGSPFGAATSRWDVAQRPVSAAAVREKRFAVSLAFSHALRAYKGKVVRLRLTNRKLFEKSLTKNFYARYRSVPLCTCVA